MKAEHRHELKTNALVEWLTNLPQWVNENRTTIIGAVVVIAVAAGLYIWKVYTKNVLTAQKQLHFTSFVGQVSVGKMQIVGARAEGTRHDVMTDSIILLQPAEMLKNLAQNASTDQMAALALIKRAEALRAELHYRLGPINSQELATQIEQAKNSYAQAIEKAPTNPSSAAAAKFGLGLCEEELGDFEKAAQTYREVAENPAYEATIASAAAKFRLETMADYKEKLTFKPAPPTSRTPTELPIEKLLIDTNMPTDAYLPGGVNLPDIRRINPPVDANPGPQSPNSVP